MAFKDHGFGAVAGGSAGEARDLAGLNPGEHPRSPGAIQTRMITSSLLSELKNLLLSGESIALLGPRYGGKSYLMKGLKSELGSETVEPVEVFFYARMRLTREQDVVRLLRKASPDLFAGDDLTFEGFFSDLEHRIQDHPKHLILLTSHVDSMVHDLARTFLRRMVPLVERRQLTIALSGELDLWKLLSGRDQEFSYGQRFLLQGFDELEFSKWIRRYADQFAISFESFGSACKQIWHQTQGNSALLGRFFWTIAEEAVLSEAGKTDVSAKQIERIFQRIATRGKQAALALNRVDDVIASHLECWEILEKLLAEGQVADTSEMRGLALQFCGVAAEREGLLTLSSPVMEAFIRQHFDQRRFGDLYAKAQIFDEAFKRYARVDRADLHRPFDIDDRAEAAAVVGAACTALEALVDGAELREFMAKAGQFILGFSDVSFWQWRRASGWTHLPDSQPDKNTNIGALDLLPSRPDRTPDPARLIETQHAAAALLEAEKEEDWCAVVVGDFDGSTAISPDRRQLLHSFLVHFVKAFNRVMRSTRREHDLQLRERLNETVTKIFRELFHKHHVGQVLKTAANALLAMNEGYQRVTFFVIDEMNRVIRAECMLPEPKAEVLAELQWTLSDKTLLHSSVLERGEPAVVIEGPHDARVDPLLRKHADNVRIIVVPIRHEDGTSVGTMQVEFDEYTKPTETKVKLLADFALHLASVLEQSRRMSLLEAALNKIPEPVLIASRNEELVFGNEAANRLLNTPVGFTVPGQAQRCSEFLPKELQGILGDINGGRQGEAPLVKLIDRIDSRDYRAAVLTAGLMDFSKSQVIGALVHIQQESYYKRILEICREVEPCPTLTEALETLVKALRNLFSWAPGWARYYEISSDRLMPRACYDPQNPKVAASFLGGDIVLYKDVANGRSWRAIMEEKPLVFCYTRDPKHPPDSKFSTPLGIPVITDDSPQHKEKLGRREGDMWIDFPLFLNRQPVGKFTVPCTIDVKPEEIRMLTDFSTILGELLKVITEREQRQESAHMMGAEQTIDAVAHDINTRIAQMSPLLGRYRNLEPKFPPLRGINESFEFSLQGTLDITARAKSLIKSAIIFPTAFDLIAALRATLSSTGVEYEIRGAPQLSIVADRVRLDTAFRELVSNSRNAAVDPAQTRVTLEVNAASEGPVRIRYTDNGPGIPKEYRARIFDLFFSRRPGREIGTGLGMNLISRTIRAHGGTIEVGQPEQGAEFIITLPKEAAAKEVPADV